MRTGGAYEGIQRGVLPVYASGQETGNQALVMDHEMRDLFVANDSESAEMTINVIGPASLNLTFVLYAGETLNERMPEFTQVNVTASDYWRWYVRSGRVT
jgi:hypothetical protein